MKESVVGACRRLLALADSLSWLGPLVLRLFFGYFWVETGWAKLQNIGFFTERFITWGIPLPHLSAILSASTDLVGGLLMMLGLFTRLAMVPMIINMVVAISLVVIKDVTSFDEFVELDEFLYILIFFWLFVAGPGWASLDTLIKRWTRIGEPASRGIR